MVPQQNKPEKQRAQTQLRFSLRHPTTSFAPWRNLSSGCSTKENDSSKKRNPLLLVWKRSLRRRSSMPPVENVERAVLPTVAFVSVVTLMFALGPCSRSIVEESGGGSGGPYAHPYYRQYHTWSEALSASTRLLFNLADDEIEISRDVLLSVLVLSFVLATRLSLFLLPFPPPPSFEHNNSSDKRDDEATVHRCHSHSELDPHHQTKRVVEGRCSSRTESVELKHTGKARGGAVEEDTDNHPMDHDTKEKENKCGGDRGESNAAATGETDATAEFERERRQLRRRIHQLEADLHSALATTTRDHERRGGDDGIESSERIIGSHQTPRKSSGQERTVRRLRREADRLKVELEASAAVAKQRGGEIEMLKDALQKVVRQLRSEADRLRVELEASLEETRTKDTEIRALREALEKTEAEHQQQNSENNDGNDNDDAKITAELRCSIIEEERDGAVRGSSELSSENDELRSRVTELEAQTGEFDSNMDGIPLSSAHTEKLEDDDARDPTIASLEAGTTPVGRKNLQRVAKGRRSRLRRGVNDWVRRGQLRTIQKKAQ